MSPELAVRLAGEPMMLFLDLDGTLSPIAPRPRDAVIPQSTRATLAALAGIRGVHVAVISGRAASDAARLVGVDSLWVIGNHGIEIAPPGNEPRVHEDIARFSDRLAAASTAAAAVAQRIPGAFVEDKRWTLSVHYRLSPRESIPELTARIAEIAERGGLTLSHGKESLELRPPVRVDKGTASLEVADQLGALGANASLLCAGDDRTDEDMFRAVRTRQPRAVTVHVTGDGGPSSETAAEFSVPGTAAMEELLATLLEARLDSAKR